MADTVSLVHGGHAFYANESGGVDIWRLEEGYHNGPECARCGAYFCEHCDPEKLEQKCPLFDTALPGLDFQETTNDGSAEKEIETDA